MGEISRERRAELRGRIEPGTSSRITTGTDPTRGEINKLCDYADELDKAVALLKVAACPDPNCDGEGTSAQQVTEQEPRCCGHFLESGECCGEAIAVPVASLEQVQCQWCHERDALLRRVGDSNE